VKLLLKAKADPNIKRLDGATALSIATENKHLKIVQMLKAA
jgi:ankyrin repeat protein